LKNLRATEQERSKLTEAPEPSAVNSFGTFLLLVQESAAPGGPGTPAPPGLRAAEQSAAQGCPEGRRAADAGRTAPPHRGNFPPPLAAAAPPSQAGAERLGGGGAGTYNRMGSEVHGLGSCGGSSPGQVPQGQIRPGVANRKRNREGQELSL
jgi:hypothetical protein